MHVIKKFLNSRKFWAFLTSFVGLAGAAAQDGTFTAAEIQNLVILAVGYIFSVAFEDGMSQFGRDPNPPVQNVNWNSLTTEQKQEVLDREIAGL